MEVAGVKTEHIIIEFKYKTFASDDWNINDIPVKEYFDLSMLDEGEDLKSDSVPMYSNLIDYFDDEHRQIFQISLDIIDTKNNTKLHIFKSFWNDQNNWICERIDIIDGTINYHEIIIESELPTETTRNSEKDYEIMRFLLEEEGVKCLYHGIIHDNEDGSQSEISVEPKI